MSTDFFIDARQLAYFPVESADFSPAVDARYLAFHAVRSMVAEADLTPKPGLVDRRGSGSHADLNLALMHRSALSLFSCFRTMATMANRACPTQSLREQLAAIGRDGEETMFAATGGVNTHKGAIWAIGLLVSGASMCPYDRIDPATVAQYAADVAHHPDSRAPDRSTNGSGVIRRFRVVGARGEAQEGFPSVIERGLPALRAARKQGADEDSARLDALMAIMAELDDTCLLHRGGWKALDGAKSGARKVIECGGTATEGGRRALDHLDKSLLEQNVSPGGSADLLAATLFLDAIEKDDRKPYLEFKFGEGELWRY
ncbi:MAG: triphosphoribosyl-dephospho-CoA synthase [Negativicutes bacterium]|nr:triphosphoribosyl-dephospho-CoA synthase [Negativicutes bacterium]